MSHATYKPRVACTIVWQPWAIKNRTPMGFVVLMKNVLFGPFALLKEMKLKKRNTYGVVFHLTY